MEQRRPEVREEDAAASGQIQPALRLEKAVPVWIWPAHGVGEESAPRVRVGRGTERLGTYRFRRGSGARGRRRSSREAAEGHLRVATGGGAPADGARQSRKRREGGERESHVVVPKWTRQTAAGEDEAATMAL